MGAAKGAFFTRTVPVAAAMLVAFSSFSKAQPKQPDFYEYKFDSISVLLSDSTDFKKITPALELIKKANRTLNSTSKIKALRVDLDVFFVGGRPVYNDTLRYDDSIKTIRTSRDILEKAEVNSTDTISLYYQGVAHEVAHALYAALPKTSKEALHRSYQKLLESEGFAAAPTPNNLRYGLFALRMRDSSVFQLINESSYFPSLPYAGHSYDNENEAAASSSNIMSNLPQAFIRNLDSLENVSPKKYRLLKNFVRLVVILTRRAIDYAEAIFNRIGLLDFSRSKDKKEETYRNEP